jgi:hypothetical protein
MATSFHPSDIVTCFGTNCDNKPQFKVVEWLGAGLLDDGEPSEAGAAVKLVCRVCLIEELDAFRDELDGTLSADIPAQALLVLPIRLSDEQVSSLREEITPHVWLDSEEPYRNC